MDESFASDVSASSGSSFVSAASALSFGGPTKRKKARGPRRIRAQARVAAEVEEEKRKAFDLTRRAEEERTEIESERQKLKEEKDRIEREKRDFAMEKSKMEVRVADFRPVGKHVPTACGTQPGQIPASGHQSRRVLHSTGHVPVLDGVQRQQPAGAYRGLPVDYGHRESYLRPLRRYSSSSGRE